MNQRHRRMVRRCGMYVCLDSLHPYHMDGQLRGFLGPRQNLQGINVSILCCDWKPHDQSLTCTLYAFCTLKGCTRGLVRWLFVAARCVALSVAEIQTPHRLDLHKSTPRNGWQLWSRTLSARVMSAFHSGDRMEHTKSIPKVLSAQFQAMVSRRNSSTCSAAERCGVW
jgi:hypothetical protein